MHVRGRKVKQGRVTQTESDLVKNSIGKGVSKWKVNTVNPMWKLPPAANRQMFKGRKRKPTLSLHDKASQMEKWKGDIDQGGDGGFDAGDPWKDRGAGRREGGGGGVNGPEYNNGDVVGEAPRDDVKGEGVGYPDSQEEGPQEQGGRSRPGQVADDEDRGASLAMNLPKDNMPSDNLEPPQHPPNQPNHSPDEPAVQPNLVPEHITEGRDENRNLPMQVGNMNQPVQDRNMPGQNGNLPEQDTNKRLPGKDRVLPGKGEDRKLPGQDGILPEQDGRLPDQDGRLPEQDGRLPGQDRKLPGQDGRLPGQDGRQPGKNRVLPEQDTRLPVQDGNPPGRGGERAWSQPIDPGDLPPLPPINRAMEPRVQPDTGLRDPVLPPDQQPSNLYVHSTMPLGRPLASTKTERQEAVVQAFQHAWKAYRDYAWGEDEVNPISQTSSSNYFGMGMTLVDSLDTIWLMGLEQEFQDARNWVEQHLNFDHNTKSVSLFETNIRVLGGLLSAYHLSGDRMFLDKAVSGVVGREGERGRGGRGEDGRGGGGWQWL